ncbi:MAG: HU family DNA-binding protein [Desulfobacterales bacterium]|jgi:nucleoid DNA-binding protein
MGGGMGDVNFPIKSRKGRNLQTGEAIKIMASTVVKFKAGKKLITEPFPILFE